MDDARRSFVALLFDAKTRAALLRARDVLEAHLAGHASIVRWVAPEHYHLTLRFLGAADDEQVLAMTDAITESGARFPPVDLRLSGFGAFPDLRWPSVVWCGVADVSHHGTAKSVGLSALQASIEAAARSFGFPPERRPYRPHVTLGRVDRRAHGETRRALGAALAEIEESGHATLALERRYDQIALMASERTPRGPRYETLAETRLSKTLRDA